MGFNRATEPPEWATARLRQLGYAQALEGARVYVEERTDQRCTGSGATVRRVVTRQRGVAIETPDRSLFASSPAGEGPTPAWSRPPNTFPDDVRFLWTASSQDVWVALPDGSWSFDRRMGGWARVEALFLTETECCLGVFEETTDLKASLDLSRMIDGARARAQARRRPRPATTGPCSVVLAPSLAGVVVHELAGHRLDGDRSAQTEAVRGERIGPPELTVVDDPRRGRLAWRIDDTGQVASPVVLVGRGKAEGFLADGHRRRVSFREPPLPRMGCTFIRPGSDRADAILASTRRGIYVHRMSAAGVDPHRRRAVFRVTDADAIEAGRREAPLEPFLLEVEAGSDGIPFDAVADDLAFDRCIGSCVRDGQPLPTSVGAPTCRLRLARVLA